MTTFRVKLNTRAAAAAASKGAQQGLTAAAEHVLTEANKIVPHETGTLQRSGSTDVDDNQAAISYDTPYAVKQHEDMTLRHDAGRRAKYLETTLSAEAGTVGKIIATAIRNQMG